MEVKGLLGADETGLAEPLNLAFQTKTVATAIASKQTNKPALFLGAVRYCYDHDYL